MLIHTTSELNILKSNIVYSSPLCLPSTVGVHSHLGQEGSLSYKLWSVQHGTTLHEQKMQYFVLMFCISFVCAGYCMTFASLHPVFLRQDELRDKSQVSRYCCRCRIPECESTEATFNPEWLQNAVPFHQHDARSVPRRCLRFASRNLSLLSDDTERNVTFCSSESFDNHSVFRCDEWVYAGEETTVLREVRYTCMHSCTRSCFWSGPLNQRPQCCATHRDI